MNHLLHQHEFEARAGELAPILRGLQRMAEAEAAGVPINLTHMAVG